MRALHRTGRDVAAILVVLAAALSCRESEGPTGAGRVAPTRASLAVAPSVDASAGDPVIPLRQARIRLYRLPGLATPVPALDTMVPFRETDDDRAVTLGVTLTMANERFGLALGLVDDRGDVVYVGYDTVIAYTSGRPPAAKPLRLRYAGPDTAVVRIALAPRDTVLAIGDALPVRASAFLGDGRTTSARLGFAVHGSSAITVDAAGVLRARTPVAGRTAWVVGRTATGLTDSIAVGAIVPARTVTLTPGSARLTVGKTLALAAVARDSTGAPLVDRELAWRSSNPAIATVTNGKVTGVGVGSAEITATSEQATGTAVVAVYPGGVARVLASVAQLRLRTGEQASVSAIALDALGDEIAGGSVRWSVADGGVASVGALASAAAAKATVLALAPGVTSVVATIDGVSATIEVEVQRPPAVRVTIAPRGASLRVGQSVTLAATARDASGAALPASIAWQSLSPAVATVDAGGVVRAVADGHARIVASVDGVSDTVTIDVIR